MNHWPFSMKIGLIMLCVGALVSAVSPAWADDPAHANLVARYTFDIDFTDSAGSTFENGTSVGGALIQSGTVMIGSGALELDGNNDSVDINYAGELNFDLVNDSYSAMAWVFLRSSSTNEEHVFITHDQASGTGRVWLALVDPSPDADNAIEDKAFEFIGGPGGNGKDPNFTPRDQWAHIAVTQDNTDLLNPLTSLYVNGILVQSSSDPAEAASGGLLRIGHHKAGAGNDKGLDGFLDGFLDDLRFYNKALDDTEIAALVPSDSSSDFDSDGDVDGADFLLWQRDLGDATSLANWEAAYGTAPTEITVVGIPEPSTLLLTSILLMLTGSCRERK